MVYLCVHIQRVIAEYRYGLYGIAMGLNPPMTNPQLYDLNRSVFCCRKTVFIEVPCSGSVWWVLRWAAFCVGLDDRHDA